MRVQGLGGWPHKPRHYASPATAPPQAHVAMLKDWIAAHTGVPVEAQRIIYRGRVLENHQRLCDAGIETDSVVFMVERPPPEPARQPQPAAEHGDGAAFAEWLEAHNERMMDGFVRRMQQQFGHPLQHRPQSPAAPAPAGAAAGAPAGAGLAGPPSRAAAPPDALSGLSDFLSELERGSRMPEGLPPISSMTSGMLGRKCVGRFETRMICPRRS